jgi:hypothetical protein
VEVLTATPELERAQKPLIERYKISYRLVMLIYRLGRRLRGQRSLADDAALRSRSNNAIGPGGARTRHIHG